MLSMLDGMGIARGRSAFNFKFEGHTESWWAQDLSAETVAELVSASAAFVPENVLKRGPIRW